MSSLPGGRLGPEARSFIQWLERAGQSWWQVLPLGPPGPGGSPYESPSAFAGWRGYLELPDAPVSRDDEAAFLERHVVWASGWAAWAGQGAIADQVRFEREWTALRRHAADHGVGLVGDMPFAVATHGADTRVHPRLFVPGLEGGVPPDAFSRTGQLWRTAVYDWPAHRRSGYAWWVARLAQAAAMFDLVRLDHFRGMVAAWTVAAGAEDARGGRWRRGPGAAPFEAASRLGAMPPLIAEDLGVITPAVEHLRQNLGLPGMRVLQFGFDLADPQSLHAPGAWPRNAVGYIGTHDNDTAAGWWESLGAGERARVAAALPGSSRAKMPWRLIELLGQSPAATVIVQAQDVLGLGSTARMNMPGRRRGQWRWALTPGALTARRATQLRAITRDAGR
ncbi:MAG: 4-alpha-glucanotransferase [Miltoncostaeaceae bacterium]